MKHSYPAFVLRRVLQAIVVILLAYIATFLVISVLPGDPVTNLLTNPENGFSPEEVEEIVAYYQLDQPVYVQLWDSLSRFLTGDLGVSLRTHLPVSDMISGVARSTFELAAMALAVALALAFAIVTAPTPCPAGPAATCCAPSPRSSSRSPTTSSGS